MYNQGKQPSKNNSFMVLLLIFILTAIACWGAMGFKGLDKIKNMFNKSDKEQTETFDKTPYLGTYYLESIDIEKKDGTTVRYEIGDSYFGELKSTSVTLEIQENSYSFITHLGMTVYTMGEWNKDSFHENMFNFYSNDLLAFSARIVDSTFIRSTTNNGETTTYTLKKA